MLAALGDFLGNTCSPSCSALLASLHECSDDDLVFQHIEEPCMSLEVVGEKFSSVKLGKWLAANNGRFHMFKFAFLLLPLFTLSVIDTNNHFLLSSFLPLFQSPPQRHLHLREPLLARLQNRARLVRER